MAKVQQMQRSKSRLFSRSTDENLLKKIAEHAMTIHKMKKIPLGVLNELEELSANEAKAQAHKRVHR